MLRSKLFDLDATERNLNLKYSNPRKRLKTHFKTIKITPSNPSVPVQVYVRIRPHFKEFLQTISSKYEVILFTASKKVYAGNVTSLSYNIMRGPYSADRVILKFDFLKMSFS